MHHETKKDSREGVGGPAGGNRNVILVLAGATVFAVLATATLAVLNAAGGGIGSFTPTTGASAGGLRGPEIHCQDGKGWRRPYRRRRERASNHAGVLRHLVPALQQRGPDHDYPESQYDALWVVMVGIDGRDDPAKVREFLNRYNIAGPAVYQFSLGSAYQVSGYPTIYVLNGENEIVGAHAGAAPKEAYESWIEEALGSGD